MRPVLTICLLFAASAPGAGSADELPDPTRPANYFKAEPIEIQDLPEHQVEFKLTAIRISPEDRAAILNGVLVHPGDLLGTARVVTIDPDAVTVEYEDRRIIIPLYTRKITKTLVKR